MLVLSAGSPATPPKSRRNSKRLSLASFLPKLEPYSPEPGPDPQLSESPLLASLEPKILFKELINDNDCAKAQAKTEPLEYPAVDLSHCKLVDLKLMSGSTYFTHLDISNNPLVCLDGLQCLTALESLNVERCGLSSLSLCLPRLVKLNAASNLLQSVDLDCPNLQYLNLDNNQVQRLVPLTRVEELSICNNHTRLDFNGWSQLAVLHCTGNTQIAGLDCRTLRILSWDGPSLVNMKSLCNARVLLYSGPSFPSFAPGVHPLQQLALTGIGLDSMPQWLPRRFPCLQVLDLSNNCLDSSCFGVLSQFPSLKSLSLVSNQIKGMDEVYQGLRSLYQLGVLDLRSNPLTQNFYQEPLEGAASSVANRSSVAFTHYYRLLKGLGVWWLDGHQIATCAQSGRWINDTALGLASIEPTNETWTPPTSMEVPETIQIDQEAEMILGALEQIWLAIPKT